MINSRLWDVHFSPKIWQITLSPPEVFFGRLILAPIFYYVVYFFITVPVLILISFFIGFKKILQKMNIYLFTIMFWFIAPFSLSFYSWRQNGLRYIIEIYPAIAIISAIGLEFIASRFAKTGKTKILVFLSIVLYLFYSLWQIKPYYLDYFNELIGGVNTVYKYNLFQTGWWGQGLREAGLYIKNNSVKGSKIGLAISPEHVLPRFNEFQYLNWTVNSRYDYVIVNNYHIIRDKFDDREIKNNYDPVYFVKADRAILVTIYRKKITN